MQPVIVRQFGMEGCGEQIALTRGNDPPIRETREESRSRR